MKKIAVAIAAFAYAGLASAGEYHSGAQLVCSDCHTMHDSRAHSFNSFSDQFVGSAVAGTSVGHHKLLIKSTVYDTCLTCHDGQTFAPDVLGNNTDGKSFTGKRSAGAINKVGGVDTYAETSGHTMGAKSLPPGYNNTDVWTGATAEGFNCADCHTPHGNGGYRNLVNKYNRLAAPNTTLTAPTVPSYVKSTTQDLTKDVTILSTTNSYDADKVAFGNAVAGSPSKLNQFCAWCHGNFHGTGTVDADGEHIRHPTDSVSLQDANHGLAVNYGVQFDLVRPIRSSTDASTVVSNAQVACMSCHKAHGNSRGFGLIYPKWTDGSTDGAAGSFSASTNLEDGDDSTIGIRSLCVSCHGMGRTYWAPK